jgi:AAA domain/UvrD-like helicase C-terminal domain
VAGAVRLAKRALPKELGGEPPPGMADELAKLPDAFGQAALGESGSVNIKKLAGQEGLWRLRHGDWRAIFKPVAGDVLVVLVGRRRDVYERLDRVRIARKGSGVRVLEVPVRPREETIAPGHAALPPTEPARPRAVPQNPLRPFSDAELLALGDVDASLVDWLRGLPETIDIAVATGQRGLDADVAQLITDLWERPSHHVGIFAEGRVPTLDDVRIDDAELAGRIDAADSDTEVASRETVEQIERLLDRSIEEWMIYLHPSQASIVRADFNGPARVRGGPGTGKTVVALHRAAKLARNAADGERVLLTTFLRNLPPVWQGLMAQLEPDARDRLEIVNLDALVRRIVAERGDDVAVAEPDWRRARAREYVTRFDLGRWFGRNEDLLLEEFDYVFSGRMLEGLDAYLALDRRGRGIALPRPTRERVWSAYRAYCAALGRARRTDFHLLRRRALELARDGRTPQFAGVVVDEAQDLTEVAMLLLHLLDGSPNRRNLLIVGDGQQSIYPGAFSLRSIGIDVRGRARVLRTNWRNTWSIWNAARAVMEGQEFDDLDDDVGLRPTEDEPGPLAYGEEVQLHVVQTPAEELEILGELLGERIETAADAGDLAVLTDTRRRASDVQRALEARGAPVVSLEDYRGEHVDAVRVGTFSRGKGLEFKEVFVPGLGETEWPSSYFVPASLTPEDHDERMARQLRTLFVAMTRARDRLVLLAAGRTAAPVNAARALMDVWEY